VIIRKLYFINFLIFFFLFVSSISQAKIITLKDCRYSWEETFSKDLYEVNNVVIDTQNKTITHSIILTNNHLQENEKLNKELNQNKLEIPIQFPTNKVNKFEYKIISTNKDDKINDSIIFKGQQEKNIFNVFIKEKRIEQSFYSPITNKKITNYLYCN
jgi:hypothetical protein